jgi:poly-gamma-glutamate synthesis protein (capsule biosynthesis protein)
VVHSLGNFVFDMDFMRETQEGFVLDLRFRDGAPVAARPTPYVIGPDFAPRPAHGARARSILRDVSNLALLPR